MDRLSLLVKIPFLEDNLLLILSLKHFVKKFGINQEDRVRNINSYRKLRHIIQIPIM